MRACPAGSPASMPYTRVTVYKYLRALICLSRRQSPPRSSKNLWCDCVYFSARSLALMFVCPHIVKICLLCASVCLFPCTPNATSACRSLKRAGPTSTSPARVKQQTTTKFVMHHNPHKPQHRLTVVTLVTITPTRHGQRHYRLRGAGAWSGALRLPCFNQWEGWHWLLPECSSFQARSSLRG
jgi:hypothetical protein